MSGCDVRRKVAALAVLAIFVAAVPSLAQAGASAPEVRVESPLGSEDPGATDPAPQSGDEPVPLPFTPPTASEILFHCDHLSQGIDQFNPRTDAGPLVEPPECGLDGHLPATGEVPPDLRVDVQSDPAAISPAPETSTGTRPDVIETGPPIQASSSTPTPAEAAWPPEATLVALTLAVAGLLAPLVVASRGEEENEIRRRIYEMVCEDPGISATALADALDVHLTTAIYHLDQLRDDDRIEGVEEGRSTLYFENHRKYGRMEKRVLTTLKKGTAADLLELVAENPGIHPAELARQLDLSRTSIKWHTDRLADDGLIEKQPSGATLQLKVPDQAEQLLRKYRAA